jgi:exosome complex component RRP41
MAAFSQSERRRVSKQDRRAQEIALFIRQTFESVILCHLFPRSEIAIFIEVLQADGGVG